MKTSLKRIIFIALTILLIFWACEEFLRRKVGGFAGSYPFVSTWELNAPEGEVIKKIIELKKSNPKLQLPNDTILISDKFSYWTYIKFYYSDSKEIVYTWIRPEKDSSKTTLALVSFATLDNPQAHRLINRDFWFLPNLQQKIKFEREIVNPLKEKIK